MRVNHVKSARKTKKARVCGQCQHTVEPGEAYKYAEPRYGPTKIRCSGCHFRPSDLQDSDKMADLYLAQEGLEDDITAACYANDPADLPGALNTAAEAAREVGEAYGESADNIESAFTGGSPTADDCREKADSIEEWADALESAAGDIEGFLSELEELQAAVEEARENLAAAEEASDDSTDEDETAIDDAQTALEEAEQAVTEKEEECFEAAESVCGELSL